jgi:hypothetical protein
MTAETTLPPETGPDRSSLLLPVTSTAAVCARCGRASANDQPCGCCPKCSRPKSATALRCYACAWPGRVPRSTTRQPLPEVPEVGLPATRALRLSVRYRVYCFSCGRSSEVDTAPRQVSRCEACGGTMLVEMADNTYT